MENLTTKFRPKSFSEMRGQDTVKTILQSIAKNPKGVTRSLILSGGWGLGKALSWDTRILTPDGYILMKDIKVGDIVLGSYFNVSKVTGVYPQGKKQIYRIIFNNDENNYVDCCIDHLWEVVNIDNRFNNSQIRQPHVQTTREILSKIKNTIYGIRKPNKEYQAYPIVKDNFNIITSIVEIPSNTEMVCISVDAPDKLFQVNNGILTHNTTASRVFAKALNCESKTGDACNNCGNCKTILESNMYQEYDSSVVGNVERMRELRDELSYSASNGFKTVIFDESHLISKASFSTLLKVLEESPPNIFYVFPTTNIEKMLDTIKSRSLILKYEELTPEEMKEQLRFVCKSEGKDLPEDVEKYIIRRVRGHIRDALQQLQLFFILGKDDFNKQSILLDKVFFNLIKSIMNDNMEQVRVNIDLILKHPVPYIQQDFEEFIKKISNDIFISAQIKKTDSNGNVTSSNAISDRATYKKVIEYYFRNNKFIHDTNHWYIFLSSLVSFIKEPDFFNFK